MKDIFAEYESELAEQHARDMADGTAQREAVERARRLELDRARLVRNGAIIEDTEE